MLDLPIPVSGNECCQYTQSFTNDGVNSRKKCNQNTFPVCGTCARLNLECVREPVRKVVPPELLLGGQTPTQTQTQAQTQAVVKPRSEAPWSSSPPTTPLFLLSQPSLLAKPAEAVVESETIASHHRYAMRYYVNELANHFSVSPHFNSFLSGKSSPLTTISSLPGKTL